MNECVLHHVNWPDARVVEEYIDRFSDLVWSLTRRLYTTPAEAEDKVHEIYRFADHCEMEARGI